MRLIKPSNYSYAAIYLAQAIWLRLGDNSIETHQRLYNVMTLVRNIGYVRLFTMLVELGTGLRCTILTTRDNDKQGDKGREERFREITHGCLYTVAAVLYILTGAEFIGRIFLLSADSVPEVATLSSFVDVGIALHILLLVSFTLALVLMIYVFFLARRASLVGNVSKSSRGYSVSHMPPID